MKIEVKQDVFWDTETKIQSEEAITWMQEEVRPNLSLPTLDAHQRPNERTFENTTVKVIEKQIYIAESNDWARKGVEYLVTLKTE